MRVLIVHAFYEPLGGGEFLSLMLAKVLQRAGQDVTILTTTEPDRDLVLSMFGIDISGLRIVVRRVPYVSALRTLLRGRLARLRRLMVYGRLFSESVERYGSEFDVVIETQSNIPAPADISYIRALAPRVAATTALPTAVSSRANTHYAPYTARSVSYGGPYGRSRSEAQPGYRSAHTHGLGPQV